MTRRTAPLMFAVLATAIALVPGPPASGCAVVQNQGGSVAVADEVAVIVYDEATKTEHFVRRATFRTTSTDFGFLVPTPSLPELTPAKSSALTALAKMTEPKVEVRRVETTNFGCGGLLPTAAAPKGEADPLPMKAAPGGVAVMQQVKVAGYDAVSLKADDPKELNTWLGKNGYVSRPSLVEWFDWYTKNKWIVTAFKLGEGAEPDGSGKYRVDNRLVRMSFQTDRPFYPYREPADAAAQAGLTSDRLLRVYVLASEKSRGRIGRGKDSTDWPGQTVWAGVCEPATVGRVGSAYDLKDLQTDRTWVLTEFEDRSFPRPATDEVYFGPDPDPSPVERPKRIEFVYTDVTNQRLATIGLLAGLLPLVLIAGLFVAWKVLRKK
jgi:hypothetical protein